MGVLDGRVALVTGGGTGIGRAVALDLAKGGAEVVICGRRQEPLDETVVFNLGPEDIGVRLNSIVTPVDARHDHGEHLTLRAAEVGWPMHQLEIQVEAAPELFRVQPHDLHDVEHAPRTSERFRVLGAQCAGSVVRFDGLDPGHDRLQFIRFLIDGTRGRLL